MLRDGGANSSVALLREAAGRCVLRERIGQRRHQAVRLRSLRRVVFDYGA